MGPGDFGYNPTPGFAGQIHCDAFVVDAQIMMMMDDTIVKKFKEIHEEANHRGKKIPVVLLLINITFIC